MSSDVIEVGQVVEGTVTGITHFGAFIALPNGKTGLVHISEVADAYVKDIKDYLHDNDVVKVRILSMDENGKTGLSIRQAVEPRPDAPPREVRPPREPREPREPSNHREPRGHGRAGNQFARGVQPTFEDKLQRFMRDSEDRLQDLKRSTESKRGGRGAGR
ncbi:MAG: S1 RNA-binding domain-containing protein [Firmicutes bacterium]|jgi:S1 RNA binding domain protein|nr:S1 RNA-binding domain-containing protein [Bacillota bacterium]